MGSGTDEAAMATVELDSHPWRRSAWMLEHRECAGFTAAGRVFLARAEREQGSTLWGARVFDDEGPIYSIAGRDLGRVLEGVGAYLAAGEPPAELLSALEELRP